MHRVPLSLLFVVSLALALSACSNEGVPDPPEESPSSFSHGDQAAWQAFDGPNAEPAAEGIQPTEAEEDELKAPGNRDAVGTPFVPIADPAEDPDLDPVEPPEEDPEPPEEDPEGSPPGMVGEDPDPDPDPTGPCGAGQVACENEPLLECELFTVGLNARPVDIVIAIDQSGSMDGEIKKVREKMNDFAAYITSLSVDFHVVLVATRFDNDNEVCIPPPLAGVNCGDGPQFKQIDQHVGSHNALVQVSVHIESIEAFMREGSVRHFVVITDDESSKLDNNADGSAWEQFEAFLLARPGYEDFVFQSIVGLENKGCAADKGQTYLSLSAATNGLVFDICSADWDELFVALGEEVAVATMQFLLDGQPAEETLVITIDGEEALPGDHYDYDPAINQIVLLGAAPEEGTVVEVCYLSP